MKLTKILYMKQFKHYKKVVNKKELTQLIRECSTCSACVRFFGNVIGCKEGVKPENVNGWGCNQHRREIT